MESRRTPMGYFGRRRTGRGESPGGKRRIRGRAHRRAEEIPEKTGKAKRTSRDSFSFIYSLAQRCYPTLFFLMAVLAKTFFTLVGSHLVTLMLLSVRHSVKILEVLESVISPSQRSSWRA